MIVKNRLLIVVYVHILQPQDVLNCDERFDWLSQRLTQA